MNPRLEALKSKLKDLPATPGVYIFRNQDGEPIYVGKATSLKSRVSSYFRGLKKHQAKTRALMNHVYDLETIALDSEQEALIKENELIKKWQPHYNIMLRDDKTYPWVKVTVSDVFPLIYFTRKVAMDGSLYYGPYPKVWDAKKIVQYVIETYKIRDCKQDIQEGIPAPACLSLQIGRCDGPCVDAISAKDYRKCVQKACAFLEGQQKDILRTLKKEMEDASAQMKFELAAEKRDMIQAAQTIKKGTTLKKKVNPATVLSGLKTKLGLQKTPRHIECFDISHVGGTHSVASMVVFKNGQPSSRDYRTFKIKTVEGIDDFASMAEVIRRRYQRCLKEGIALPDLIMVDGGPGQLHAAAKVLQDLSVTQDLISLAKRLELIYVYGRKEPIILSKYTDELQLLQYVRDESHRFAITFHRRLRDQSQFHSQLHDVAGVGPVLADRLLQRFKTVDNIRQQSLETLSDVSGVSVELAEAILRHLKE